MNRPPATRLQVFVDLAGTTNFAGTCYVMERRGVVSTAFDYAPAYVSDLNAYPISPDLPLHSLSHHLTGLPGAFADSTPDRWGRNLIQKQLRAAARTQVGTARAIAETDYLLGVSDLTRQGALRYATDLGGPFLAAGSGDRDGVPTTPQLIELPRLLQAADQVAAYDAEDDLAAVKALLDAGSGSLGGARPKASVRDGDAFLIAKFPHRADEWDLMGWEKTTLDLAESAGIPTPPRRLVDVGGRHVLLLDRFDRRGGRRIGYISGLTLLNGADGDRHDYLELAEAIAEHGSDVRNDLAQLWRRIAFSIVVNDTDDHMRNHGFLRAGSGWRLSPVFDVNPDPEQGRARASSIRFTADADQTADALIASCADFRLSTDEALGIFEGVCAAVRPWRDVAAANGIAEAECARFAETFDRYTA